MIKRGTKILLTKGDTLLLQHRDNKKGLPNANLWSLIGGEIDDRESKENSICREVLEEIGLNIENPTFLNEQHDFRNGNELVSYIFEDTIEKEIEELTLGEGQEIRYFNYQDVKNIEITPIYERMIFSKLETLEGKK